MYACMHACMYVCLYVCNVIYMVLLRHRLYTVLSSTVIRIYGLPIACQAFSSLLNRTGDVVHGGRLLQTACQIHHGHIRGGHSEGHPRQLAVHRWDHLANSLGSSGGRWDDVLRCATSTAPILAAVAVAVLLY